MTTDSVRTDLGVDELCAELRRLRADLDDLTASLTGDGIDLERETTVHPRDLPAPIEPVYPTLYGWVHDYYLPVFPRPTAGEQRWCQQWDEHPEAVTRLEALWRSWETLRLDPNLGIATWLTTYHDPITSRLTSRTDVFAACTAQRHSISGSYD